MARIGGKAQLSERQAERAAAAVEGALKGERTAIARRFGFKEPGELYRAVRRWKPDWGPPRFGEFSKKSEAAPHGGVRPLTRTAGAGTGFSRWTSGNR